MIPVQMAKVVTTRRFQQSIQKAKFPSVQQEANQFLKEVQKNPGTPSNTTIKLSMPFSLKQFKRMPQITISTNKEIGAKSIKVKNQSQSKNPLSKLSLENLLQGAKAKFENKSQKPF